LTRKTTLKLISLSLILLLLSSCGFHLRGTAPLPKQLKVLYVTSENQPNSPFMKALRMILKARGVTLVSSPNQAKYTLNIVSTSLTSAQAGVASSQQMRQYNIVLTATYSIQSAKGLDIAGPMSTSSSTTQTMQANELLTNTAQLNTTREQLQQDVITMMFYRLSAKSTLQALNDYSAGRMKRRSTEAQ